MRRESTREDDGRETRQLCVISPTHEMPVFDMKAEQSTWGEDRKQWEEKRVMG